MNKCVSLPTDIIELEKQVFMAKKARDSRPQQVMSEEEKFENKTELIEQLKADEVLVEEQFKKDIEE